MLELKTAVVVTWSGRRFVATNDLPNAAVAGPYSSLLLFHLRCMDLH